MRGPRVGAKFVGRGYFQPRYGLSRLVALQVACSQCEGNEDLVDQGIGRVLAGQIVRDFLAARGVSGPGQQLHDNRPGAAVLRECESIRDFLTRVLEVAELDRKSTRLNSSHVEISYAV